MATRRCCVQSGPGLPPSAAASRMSTDSNPRWCSVDPRTGTALARRRVGGQHRMRGSAAVAVVNCLNFGNPEHEEVMWQLSEAVDGMAEACRALGLPVVGGNVSLYNESSGADISPTPVVAALGVIDEPRHAAPGSAPQRGRLHRLLGRALERARRIAAGGRKARHARRLASDLGLRGSVRALVGALVRLVSEGLVSGVHDVSDGGTALCLAEMAVRSGTGFRVSGGGVADRAELFSEMPGRAVACTDRPDDLLEVARVCGCAGSRDRTRRRTRVVVEGLVDLAVGDLVDTLDVGPAQGLGRAVGGRRFTLVDTNICLSWAEGASGGLKRPRSKPELLSMIGRRAGSCERAPGLTGRRSREPR